jgi:hypothetical protein
VPGRGTPVIRPAVGFTGDAALVAGELRGYRQFQLRRDGLYPLFRADRGPWAGGTEHAGCAHSTRHVVPDRACGCGLYGWYHPGDAAGRFGGVAAVIAAHGRIILGDKGFRAAAARVDAVTLPVRTRVRPAAAAQARRMLATCYPHAQVYLSRRQMLRDHPPAPLDDLGIQPRRDRVRACFRMTTAAGALFLAVAYLAILLPPPVLPATIRRTIVLGASLVVVGVHLLLSAVAAIRPRRPPLPAPPRGADRRRPETDQMSS